MLHGGVLVLHVPGDFFRPVQGLFRVAGDVNSPHLVAGGGDPGLALQLVFHGGFQRGDGDPHP